MATIHATDNNYPLNIAIVRNTDNDGVKYPFQASPSFVAELMEPASVRFVRISFSKADTREQFRKGTLDVYLRSEDSLTNVYSGKWTRTVIARLPEGEAPNVTALEVLCEREDEEAALEAGRPITVNSLLLMGRVPEPTDSMKDIAVRSLSMYAKVLEPVVDAIEPHMERIGTYVHSFVTKHMERAMDDLATESKKEAITHMEGEMRMHKALHAVRKGEIRIVNATPSKSTDEESKGCEDTA